MKPSAHLQYQLLSVLGHRELMWGKDGNSPPVTNESRKSDLSPLLLRILMVCVLSRNPLGLLISSQRRSGSF